MTSGSNDAQGIYEEFREKSHLGVKNLTNYIFVIPYLTWA